MNNLSDAKTIMLPGISNRFSVLTVISVIACGNIAGKQIELGILNNTHFTDLANAVGEKWKPLLIEKRVGKALNK